MMRSRIPRAWKRFAAFQRTGFIKKAGLSHDILLVVKQKHLDRGNEAKELVLKKIEGYGRTPEEQFQDACKQALSEALARELYRLIIPTHPKTRVVIDEATRTVFVVSERVKDFKPLFNDESSVDIEITDERISKGQLPGLGEIMGMALWLREVDLKPHNVGHGIVKGKRVVVMIDADWCLLFSEFEETPSRPINERFLITPQLLDELPRVNVMKYGAYNWLDHIKNKFQTLVSNFFRCGKSKDFRKEINQAILKILLMPNTIMENLATHIAGDDPGFLQDAKAESLAILDQRKEQLRLAALQSISFQKFLQTDDAKKIKDDFASNMNQFVMTSKHRLVDLREEKTITEDTERSFACLQQTAQITLNFSTKDLDEAAEASKSFDDSKKLEPTISQFRAAKNDAERYLLVRDYIDRIHRTELPKDPRRQDATACDFMRALEGILQAKINTCIAQDRHPDSPDYRVSLV